MYKVLDYDTLAVVYQAKTSEEIARFVGITKDQVSKIACQIRRHGFSKRRPACGYFITGRADVDYSDRTLNMDRIAELIEAGKTDAEIAVEFNVVPMTIWKYRQRIADKKLKEAKRHGSSLSEDIRKVYYGTNLMTKKQCLFGGPAEQEQFCQEWDATVALLKKAYGNALSKIPLSAYSKSGAAL